jgi:hypothetical protein
MMIIMMIPQFLNSVTSVPSRRFSKRSEDASTRCAALERCRAEDANPRINFLTRNSVFLL